MSKVISKDGTPIAFDRSGRGAPIILVVGAFNERATGAPLAHFLEDHFTVYTYDRRGRGESGDTLPYAVEREVEDLAALITEAGGAALVFGYSSGAILSLKAAARGLAITQLALYEPPLIVDASRPRPSQDLKAQLSDLVASGRRGEAVELFQTKVVGIPVEIVARIRNAPFRPALERMAHTLVYEMTILGDMSIPTEPETSITIPTLVLSGGDSPAFMHQGRRRSRTPSPTLGIAAFQVRPTTSSRRSSPPCWKSSSPIDKHSARFPGMSSLFSARLREE